MHPLAKLKILYIDHGYRIPLLNQSLKNVVVMANISNLISVRRKIALKSVPGIADVGVSHGDGDGDGHRAPPRCPGGYGK